MLFFGWLNIYAANFGEGTHDLLSMSTEPGKQLFWIGSSFIWILLILIIDGKFYTTFSYFMYAITILLLIGVLVVGKEIGGAKSWYAIGSFSMQPSEFAKIGTLLALSKYLSTLNINLDLMSTKIKALAIIMAPIFFIMLQPDAGLSHCFCIPIPCVVQRRYFRGLPCSDRSGHYTISPDINTQSSNGYDHCFFPMPPLWHLAKKESKITKTCFSIFNFCDRLYSVCRLPL
jgi:hypothetical protein